MEHRLHRNTERVLIISNYLSRNPITWFSLLIRMVTYGPNHAARYKDGYVFEMVGSGLKRTELGEWLGSAKRKVRVYIPTVTTTEPNLKGGYGFLQIVQFFLHIVRRKWLLIGHDWNGRDGTKLLPGTFCSQYIGLYLGRPDAYLLAPVDLQQIPELKFEYEFETHKSA